MKHLLYILIGIVITKGLICCTGSPGTHYPRYTTFPEEKAIRAQIIPLDTILLRYPFRVAVRDSIAVVMDLHNMDHYLHAFTYPEWKHVVSFGKRGEAPEEMLSAENIQFNSLDSLWTLDANKMEITRWKITPSTGSEERVEEIKLNKKLEKLNVPIFEKKEEINFDIEYDNDKGNKDICLNKLVIGYKDFSKGEYNFNIPFKTRLKINGKNGTGKSTLIKTIFGDIAPLKGNVKIGSAVKFGYISQETFSDKDLSIYEYLTENLCDIDNGFLFTVLDKFNISYDEKDKKYLLLSPGQRTRVNFAKLALQKVNVLLLDEVTNHLDKEALEVFYEVIRSFKGTIICVSHNRKFERLLNPNMILDIETGSIIKK